MRRAALLLVIAGALAACAGSPEMASLVVDTRSGSVELRVEVAEGDDDRQQGLMGRAELAEQAGMLFLFDGESSGGFWMKDTLIPLSVAFIDSDGEILSILDMEPCDADPCPVYDPGVAYHAAVEVNQGAFEELGIEVGDRADLPR
jgi:uncharacterized membrane protein (UPF0127 family)